MVNSNGLHHHTLLRPRITVFHAFPAYDFTITIKPKPIPSLDDFLPLEFLIRFFFHLSLDLMSAHRTVDCALLSRLHMFCLVCSQQLSVWHEHISFTQSTSFYGPILLPSHSQFVSFVSVSSISSSCITHPSPSHPSACLFTLHCSTDMLPHSHCSRSPWF